MIRFSAALVAVAIGVLIGGIATSKLLLVYIAIVVSAVALLALAIGVVLKREELFGEGQGLVPAGAGAAPVSPARVGETQVQPRQDASVPSSAPFPGPATVYDAAFEGAAFAAGAAQAAPSATAPPAEPSTPYQATAGHGRDRVANPVPPWEPQPARDQWSSPPWQGGSTVSGPVVSGSPGGSAVAGPPVADDGPDWMPGERGATGPASQAEETAPRSWFDRQARSAEAARPAEAGPQADPGHAPAGADATTADEDDDWPTRYSWLNDEPDESTDEANESDTPVSPADDAGPVPEATVPAGSRGDLAQDAAAADTVAAPPTVSTPAAVPAPPTVSVPAVVPAPPTVPAPVFDPEPAARPGQDADPGQVTGPGQDAGPEQEPVRAEDGPPSTDPPGAAEAAGLVAVLRGVPRYHQPDCVLIRFLPEDDIQRLPVAQAKANGCTPCAACEPAEQ